MNIAILYIAIGRYDAFWPAFRNSCDRNFLPDAVKHYFVFTDSARIPEEDHVHPIRVPDRGWPANTLHRFDFFESIQDRLTAFDYCFFLNANALVVKTIIASDILPGPEQDHLTALYWYDIGTKTLSELPYDRNPASKACMAAHEGGVYYQGGFYGGRTPEFLSMNAELSAQVEADRMAGVVARNNDESHLNRYLADRHPRRLDRRFGKPAEWADPADALLVFRHKESVVGLTRTFVSKGKSLKWLFWQLKYWFRQNSARP